MSDRPWAMAMRWHELLFMDWPVEPAALRPLVPSALPLDTFDGAAWVGVVPFRMTGVRPRLVPPVPGLSAFPELNVRTYVLGPDGQKPGVWFFSLDAAKWPAVRVARHSYHLNYFDAAMRCRRDGDGVVQYESRRTHKGARPAEFRADYHPDGDVYQARPGTLDYFLTERYCLYSASPDGRVWRCEIAHAPWPLQPARATTHANTMAAAAGIELPAAEPLLHYAHFQEVVAWRPVRV